MRLALLCLLALTLEAQTNVLTYHNDNAHTGQYLNETLLTPSNVNAAHFGWRNFLATDGPVFAQPLFLSRVKIAGKGLRNVVYVATAHDSVYAFDADDTSSPPLWKVNFLDEAHGVTTATKDDVNCVVVPELGITGTPVVDATAGTIYLIAETKEPGSQFVYRLHALDVTNGAERPGSPVVIRPPGFDPASHKQRTSLLLSNGVIYSSWSGHCDLGTFHGWVMAHDAKTLKFLGLFNTTPFENGASFWNGGAGPAADAKGNLYVVSANGDINGIATPGGYDEAVLKLGPAPQLRLLDLFTPFNVDLLDAEDVDLGSSGAVVLPDEAGSMAHPHLVFTCGKEGRMYLLDRDALGGAQSGTDTKAVASLAILSSHSAFGSAAYFDGSIYIAPEHSPMLRFPVSNASLASSPAASTPDTIGELGAIPSISANGAKDGIVWITATNQGGNLLAYDAASLRKLYDSNAQPNATRYTYTEFTVATIAGGKVYVPGSYAVSVYGELPGAAPVVTAAADGAAFSPDSIAPGSLISIFGSGLSQTTRGATTVPLPLSINDVSVTIDGIAAPILYVSPKQINVQVPSEVPAGTASVVVRVQGAPSQPVTISLKAAAPALFADAHGQAAALDPDGTANSVHSPAIVGSLVSFFFTGQGPVDSDVDDGDAPKTGSIVSATSQVSATIDGVPAEVQFVGLAPGLPGVAQINLRIPSLSAGVYPVVINVAGVASNAAQVAVAGQ